MKPRREWRLLSLLIPEVAANPKIALILPKLPPQNRKQKRKSCRVISSDSVSTNQTLQRFTSPKRLNLIARLKKTSPATKTIDRKSRQGVLDQVGPNAPLPNQPLNRMMTAAKTAMISSNLKLKISTPATSTRRRLLHVDAGPRVVDEAEVDADVVVRPKKGHQEKSPYQILRLHAHRHPITIATMKIDPLVDAAEAVDRDAGEIASNEIEKIKSLPIQTISCFNRQMI